MSNIALFTISQFEDWMKQIFALQNSILDKDFEISKLEFQVGMYKIMYDDLKKNLDK